MSRRTKLCITALFLVLLASPAVYVALTWSTRDPLRFRILAYHPPSSPGATEGWGRLYLEMENTSSLPVHFYIPGFQRSTGSRSAAQLQGITPPPPHNEMFLLIPPQRTAQFSCWVISPSGDVPPSAWENAEVFYYWMSGTRYRCRLLLERLFWHTPRRFQFLIRYSPDFDIDVSVLRPSKLETAGGPQPSQSTR